MIIQYLFVSIMLYLFSISLYSVSPIEYECLYLPEYVVLMVMIIEFQVSQLVIQQLDSDDSRQSQLMFLQHTMYTLYSRQKLQE